MKRYEVDLEMANGKIKTIEIEGMSVNDALSQMTNNNRFIKDLKTGKYVNKDRVDVVDFKREVKHEPVS